MSKDLTVSEIQKLLDAKRSTLDILSKKRDRLLSKLSTVEARISRLAGNPGRGQRRARKIKGRPSNEKTLHAVIHDLLARNKKGYTLNDLSDKVLETGYKTGSTKFPNTVYQCLYHSQDTIYCDPETRCYRLK